MFWKGKLINKDVRWGEGLVHTRHGLTYAHFSAVKKHMGISAHFSKLSGETLLWHKRWSLESTITWMNGGVFSIFPGTIISDIGGMVTVSTTVIRNVCGMAPMRWHTGVVPSIESSVRFLRRPVGPRPATLLSGLQLQKCVGPVGRQLLYLPCGAEWCTTVNGHWRNKILFKRYTFSYDPNQH